MSSKQIILAAILALCIPGVSLYNSAEAAPRASKLSKVCKTVRRLVSSEIWKSNQSQHIPNSDPRKFSTSFIVNLGTKAPRGNCLYGYDAAGNLIHKLGTYGARGGSYTIRMYGGYGCGDRKTPSQIAALARKNTGSPSLYITSGTGNCAVIPDPTKCYNSSGC